MSPVVALRRAQELGLGLVFTEHFDWEFPGNKEFGFDAAAYFNEYEPLRGFGLRLGAEIGIAGDTAAKNREFINSAPFDLVIGSLHLLRGKDLYYDDAYDGLTRTDAYRLYFTDMARAIREQGDHFDVLGHIDYIARCAPYFDTELHYERYTELIDDVLRAAIEKDVVLEVNTRRFETRLAVEALLPIWRRYREFGGKYVTLGSDAHNEETIGKHFAAACAAVKSVGLTLVTFVQRQPHIIKM